MHVAFPRPIAAGCLGFALLVAVACTARAGVPVARYTVRVRPGDPGFDIVATLPIAGGSLDMDSSRPFGVPELDSLGWPGLVTNLAARTVDGRPLELARAGDSGWRLAAPETTTLVLRYTVDFGPLARDHWPAPREGVWHDSIETSVVGRCLFVTTAAQRATEVEFSPPPGWSACAPLVARGRDRFVAETVPELVENLYLLARTAPARVAVRGFDVRLAAMGHWLRAGAATGDAVARIAREQVRACGRPGSAPYLVVLLPGRDAGGESFRSSFALTIEAAPDSVPARQWQNLFAHELFHQWNGWRLRPAQYAQSQWFQEGFTEYVANTTLLRAGLADGADFRARIAGHLARSRALKTTLVDIGTRKGPPLYSAGALVAFCWDVRIRELTGGRADLWSVFPALLRRTDGGRRAYDWADLRGALGDVAAWDWQGEYARYVQGPGPIPLADALAALGLARADGGEDAARIVEDPAASPEARERWRRFTEGR